MAIDDGTHTLQSMIDFICKYSQLLSDNGILIIEDIPDFNWINTLEQHVPYNLKKYIQNFDLRHIKGRYDDIIFVINKNNVV